MHTIFVTARIRKLNKLLKEFDSIQRHFRVSALILCIMVQWVDFIGTCLAKTYITNNLEILLRVYNEDGLRRVISNCHDPDGRKLTGPTLEHQLFIFICDDFNKNRKRYWDTVPQRKPDANRFSLAPFQIEIYGVQRWMGGHIMHEVHGTNIPVEFPADIRNLELVLNRAPNITPEKKIEQLHAFADTIKEWITHTAPEYFVMVSGKDMREVCEKVKIINQ
jgi:hypothetical protein